VPPIFQPEVPARAIYYAAQHRRRELYCGMPAVQAIVGNKLVPGLADWYLGKTGYKAQQTQQPVSSDRPSNLFEPVEGAHATHGIFDAKATGSSPQVWLAEHRSWLAAAAGAGVAGLAVLAR
jgi:hypothetical protein